MEHLQLKMAGRASVEINADPTSVFAAIADLSRMGEWSPENRGGEWVQGGPGVVGAVFRGRNVHGAAEWSAPVTVVEVEAPRVLAFVVGKSEGPSTRWRFEIRSEDGRACVTESFEWEWEPSSVGFRATVGSLPIDEARSAVARRQAELVAGAEQTLRALKAALEAASE